MSKRGVTLAVGSDHAGVEVRRAVVNFLKKQGFSVIEVGPSTPDEKTDYPDQALEVACMVAEGRAERGILICGTGIGMSIAANKVSGVRAALVVNEFMAEFAVKHNNANVITLPGRIIAPYYGVELVRVWLASSFEGGRHMRRIEKIDAIEKEQLRKNS